MGEGPAKKQTPRGERWGVQKRNERASLSRGAGEGRLATVRKGGTQGKSQTSRSQRERKGKEYNEKRVRTQSKKGRREGIIRNRKYTRMTGFGVSHGN